VSGEASRPQLRQLFIVLGCLAGIAVNGYLKLPALPYIVQGDNDFRCYYAAAQLSGSTDLYNAEAVSRAELKLGTIPRFMPVVRLPFWVMFTSPLRLLAYEKAFWVWQLVSLAAVIVFVCLWPSQHRWVTAMACCWSAPLLDCFIMGRDVALMLMVLAVSVALFYDGRHFAAGCILSFCLIKYSLFLPLPFLIAGKRLWRLGGGILAGGAVLLAISFAGAGWSWPWAYIAMLRLPATTPAYNGMPNLHGLFSPWHSIAMEAAGTGVTLAGVWLVIRGREMSGSIAAMVAGGLLVSYHAFLGDAAMMIPVGLYLIGPLSSTAGRLVGIVLLCPLCYLPFAMSNPPFPPAALFLLPLVVMAAEEMRTRWRATCVAEPLRAVPLDRLR
jgi:hypothetical protein